MPQADGEGGDVVAIGQDVTERLAAEAAARAVARLVEDSPSPILTLDAIGRLAHANPAALALRPDGPPVGALAAAAHEELPVTVELPVGDRLIQFTLTRRPGCDEVDVFGHDITGLRDAEAARRRVDALYRHIVENTQEGILTVSTNGRILYANEHAAAMFGYRVDEMTGRSLFDYMDKSDAVLARDRLNRRRRHLAEKTEVRYRRKDGSVLWVLLAASPMYDENGRVEGSVGFLVDVTERRRLEQELRATAADLNERIKELSLLLQFNALAADPDLPLARLCAETAARLPEAMQAPERCSARIDLDGAIYLSPRFVEEGAGISQPIELANGRQGSISVFCRPDEFQEPSPFLAEERQLLAQLAHLLSMVVRRFDAEAASRASEARCRQLVDRMNEGLVVVDPGGRVGFVNPRLCEMLGVSAGSLVGHGVDAFVHPDDVPLSREQAVRRRRGESSVYRIRLARAAGTGWLRARIAASPLYDADGRFEGALGVVTDLNGEVHADEAESESAG